MRLRVAAAAIAVMLAGSRAAAQEAGQSLEEAQRTLRRGDRIQVVDHSGAVVDGRFEGISGPSLRLLRKRATLDLPEARISRIRKARHEADGIVIGLGLGAAAGLGFVTMRCSGSSEHADCLRAGSALLIGPSAAAGALIDRAFTRFETILDRRGPGIEVRVSPVFTARHTGVVLSLSY